MSESYFYINNLKLAEEYILKSIELRGGIDTMEIFNYKDIIQHKSESKLRDLGLIKQEGRNYIVEDGDCIYFKFNV